MLGQESIEKHLVIAGVLSGDALRRVRSREPQNVDDLLMLVEGAVGDLFAVHAALSVGREITTRESGTLSLKAKGAIRRWSWSGEWIEKEAGA